MNTSNQVGIYNMALSAIGINRFISSLTEGSIAAITCNTFWENARDQALQAFPWDFAMRFNSLNLLTKVTPRWLYTYAVPSDCLQERLLMPTASQISTPISFGVPGYQSYYSDFWSLWFNESCQIPFQTVENEAGGGLAIATNLATPILAYTARILTVPLFSPAFVSALVWLLGSKICAPLSASPEYAQVCGNAYTLAIREAWALSANNGAEKTDPESEFIRERY